MLNLPNQIHHLLIVARSKAQSFRALSDLLVNLLDTVRNAKRILLNNLDTRLKEWGGVKEMIL